MKVKYFATTPLVGTVLVLLGQRYVMTGSELHQRDEGRSVAVPKAQFKRGRRHD